MMLRFYSPIILSIFLRIDLRSRTRIRRLTLTPKWYPIKWVMRNIISYARMFFRPVIALNDNPKSVDSS